MAVSFADIHAFCVLTPGSLFFFITLSKGYYTFLSKSTINLVIHVSYVVNNIFTDKRYL